MSRRVRFLIFYIVCFQMVCGNNLQASEGSPYISCDFSGQLGNQLFNIASTLGLAWDNGMTPVFPELLVNREGRVQNAKRVFFRLNFQKPNQPFQHRSWGHILYQPITLDKKSNYWMKGLSISLNFFDHYRDRIIDLFSPSDEELASICSKYSDIINHPKSVGVHIRTQTPVAHHLLPFIGFKYIKEAMDKFPEDSLFIIFSCRPGWCKKYFSKYKKNMIFIEGSDYITDFFLYSMCKHNVITNSTFSWWGAYLNKNQNKKVIAPRYFLPKRPDLKNNYFPFTKSQVDGFYPKEWILLNNNFDLTPHKDILDYPSTSLAPWEHKKYVNKGVSIPPKLP